MSHHHPQVFGHIHIQTVWHVISQSIQAVDGQTCNPTCVKGGDVCMRYSYFDRDGDQTMSKYVNFCGKGVQG